MQFSPFFHHLLFLHYCPFRLPFLPAVVTSYPSSTTAPLILPPNPNSSPLTALPSSCTTASSSTIAPFACLSSPSQPQPPLPPLQLPFSLFQTEIVFIPSVSPLSSTIVSYTPFSSLLQNRTLIISPAAASFPFLHYFPSFPFYLLHTQTLLFLPTTIAFPFLHHHLFLQHCPLFPFSSFLQNPNPSLSYLCCFPLPALLPPASSQFSTFEILSLILCNCAKSVAPLFHLFPRHPPRCLL